MRHLLRELRYWREDTSKVFFDWVDANEDSIIYWAIVSSASISAGLFSGYVAHLISVPLAVPAAVVTCVGVCWWVTGRLGK